MYSAFYFPCILYFKRFNCNIFPDTDAFLITYFVEGLFCTPVNIQMILPVLWYLCYFLFYIQELKGNSCNIGTHIFEVNSYFLICTQKDGSQFMRMGNTYETRSIP